jgi:hypothetical protein
MRHRFLGSLIITAAVLAPGVGQAAGAPEGRATVLFRVYDRTYRDYHVWDDREDHAYRRYFGYRHRHYRRYSRLSRRQQASYWHWRHEDTGDR